MGLDMYLNRMPRYKECNGEDVDAIEGYLWYKERKAERPNEMKMSLEEWCGVSEDSLPPEDAIKFYAQFYEAPDDDGIFKRIMEQVGYWRKENAIHITSGTSAASWSRFKSAKTCSARRTSISRWFTTVQVGRR